MRRPLEKGGLSDLAYGERLAVLLSIHHSDERHTAVGVITQCRYFSFYAKFGDGRVKGSSISMHQIVTEHFIIEVLSLITLIISWIKKTVNHQPEEPAKITVVFG